MDGFSVRTRPFSARALADAKIGPGLHQGSAPIEAVCAPVSPLNRIADLMTQRFFEEIAQKAGVLPPRPEGGAQTMWRNPTPAFRVIAE
jgi:hypothetical protein